MNEYMLWEICMLSVLFKTACIYLLYSLLLYVQLGLDMRKMKVNWRFFHKQNLDGVRDASKMVLGTSGYIFLLKIFLLEQWTVLLTHVYLCCYCFKRGLLLSYLEVRNQEICHHQIIIWAPKMMTLLRHVLRSLCHALICFSRMVLLQLL